jgi:hypothetical protein
MKEEESGIDYKTKKTGVLSSLVTAFGFYTFVYCKYMPTVGSLMIFIRLNFLYNI